MKINWFKIHQSSVNDQTINILLYGFSFNLAYLLIYLKQGFKCVDCDEVYHHCTCNWCNNCGHDYCTCNLKLNIHNTIKDRITVRKFVIDLTLKNLSKNKINRIIYNFKNLKYECKTSIEEFTPKEINFLNQIPKYLKQL